MHWVCIELYRLSVNHHEMPVMSAVASLLFRRLCTKRCAAATAASVLAALLLLRMLDNEATDMQCVEASEGDPWCQMAARAERAKPNRTWVQLRERLLQQNVDSRLTKVLLFAYMRGGSTLLGEVFNRDPACTVLWYEPLDGFYMSQFGFGLYSHPMSLLYNDASLKRRHQSQQERSFMTDYLDQLVSCRLDGLPIETLAHPFLYQSEALRPAYRCIERVQATTTLVSCVGNIARLCGGEDQHRRGTSEATKTRCADLIRTLRMLNLKEFGTLTKQDILRRALSLIKQRELSQLHPATIYSKPTSLAHKNESFNTTVPAVELSKLTEKDLVPFYDHNRCIALLNYSGHHCFKPAKLICRHAKIVALKLVRASLADLEPLIQRVPDLHLVYYVRDPRAVAYSRAVHTRLTFQPGPTGNYEPLGAPRTAMLAEARALCARMGADLRARAYLRRKYPGLIVDLRYEDFVEDPHAAVAQLYSTLGHPVPDRFNKWIDSAMRAVQESGHFEVLRKDGRATAQGWKSKVNYVDVREMNGYCAGVLNELGYQLL